MRRSTAFVSQLCVVIAFAWNLGVFPIGRSLLAAEPADGSYPNLLVSVSGRTIRDGLRVPLNVENPVNENILDMQITGQGRLVGEYRFDLVPSENEAVFDIHFAGNNLTTNVADVGPVTLFINGDTPLRGTTRIFVDANGVRGTKATSVGSTELTLAGVCTHFRCRLLDRIARRIANQKFCEEKLEIEQIAARRSEEDLNETIDEERLELQEELNAAFLQSVREPLLRRHQFPQQFRFSTTDEALKVTVLHDGSGRSAAPRRAPALAGHPDLAIQLHQSLVNHLATGMLAGRTLTWTQLRGFEQSLSGRREIDDESTAGGELTITFAEEGPLTLKIDQGNFVLTVRGSRYGFRGGEYPAMDIVLRYQIQQTDRGVRLMMAGEPDVQLPAGDQRTLGQQLRNAAQRQFLKSMLARELGKEIGLSTITAADPLDDLGRFSIAEINADTGWLTLTYQRQSIVQ